MILMGIPPSTRSKPVSHTSADILEEMAFHSGRQIELSSDAAYLVLGGRTWIAPLEPVGQVA